MTNKQLKQKLYKIAIDGLIAANKGNPFYNKSQAMANINGAKKLLAS